MRLNKLKCIETFRDTVDLAICDSTNIISLFDCLQLNVVNSVHYFEFFNCIHGIF